MSWGNNIGVVDKLLALYTRGHTSDPDETLSRLTYVAVGRTLNTNTTTYELAPAIRACKIRLVLLFKVHKQLTVQYLMHSVPQ